MFLIIVNVHLPKDRVTQTHQSYGFVEFLTEEDADYAIKIMNQVRLYGKPIRVNKVRVFGLGYTVHKDSRYFVCRLLLIKRIWMLEQHCLLVI